MLEDPSLTQRVVEWLRAEGLDEGGAPLARGSSLLAFIYKERDRIREELLLEWIKVLDETKTQKNRAVIQASNAEDVAKQQREIAAHRLHAIEEALGHLSVSDYARARRRLMDAL